MPVASISRGCLKAVRVESKYTAEACKKDQKLSIKVTFAKSMLADRKLAKASLRANLKMCRSPLSTFAKVVEY